MRKWILVAIGGVCLLLVRPPGGAPSLAATKKSTGEADANTLRADLDRIFAESGLSNAVIAARVLSLPEKKGEGARVLYSVRASSASDGLIPASNMKLVTTAACWDRLGPDWQIRTYVGHIRAARKGEVPDLAVIGGGDPNLSGRFYHGDTVGAFRQWAEVLKKSGLSAVGRVLLDDGLFEEQTVHPNWPPNQRHKWYEAPVAALNLNDNCVDLHMAPGEVGKAAKVWTEPSTAYVELENRLETVGSKKKHRFGIVRRPLDGRPGMRLRLSGGYWVKASPAVENVAVVDPTMYFGTVLAETLRASGVAVAGPVVRARLVGEDGLRPGFVCDLIHTSRLDTTVRVANKRSQGLYAECLLKLLGAYGANPRAEYGAKAPADRPRLASWETGRAEARRWLAERGIPADGCVIDDGSGLSKENRLTAMCVTELLRVMYERHGEAFARTLAVAGRDGSLRSRMRNTAAEGRVFGKTGNVAGVSALSGYVRTRSGRWLAFSVLVNDVPWGHVWRARLAQDKMCIRLVDAE